MESNSDFFAYLPDCILLLVVSFLPFKEAARTSALSKRWKHIWRDSTTIELNENFFRNIAGQAMAPLNQVFLDFAHGFVFHHLGDIVHNFQLVMSDPKEYIADVKRLIKFAVSKKVEVLDLNFSSFYENEFLELPLCVYEHGAMRVLKLTQCDLMRVEITKLNALKSLHLVRIKLSTSALGTILSACQLLETLVLDNCVNLDYVEIPCGENLQLTSLTIMGCIPLDEGVRICAPKLEDFKYYGAFEAFELDDVASIKNVDLDFGAEHMFFDLGDPLCDLLESFDYADVLKVCSYITQVLPSGESKSQLPTSLHVTHLILKTGLHARELPGIAFLLNSCPFLESLSIEMGETPNLTGYVYPYELFNDGRLFWELWSPFHCVEYHLQSIRVIDFVATENAIATIEYFLNKATTLDKLMIVTSSSHAYITINRRLSLIEKASPLAQVVIS